MRTALTSEGYAVLFMLTYEQTLPFYLKRTFTFGALRDEMSFGIVQEPYRWVPDLPSFAKVWQHSLKRWRSCRLRFTDAQRAGHGDENYL